MKQPKDGQRVIITQIKYGSVDILANDSTKTNHADFVGKVGIIHREAGDKDWYLVQLPSGSWNRFHPEEFVLCTEKCNECKARFVCWTG